MTIHVEFFGIPRRRIGQPSLDCHAGTLGELLTQLGAGCPDFARSCLLGDTLQPHYLANINGEQFTRDPRQPLHAGDTVLILSADVGG